jgi:Allene oxide cyclase barrel like domain
MTKTKTIMTTLAAALTIATLAVGATAASARKPPTTTLTYSIRFSPFFLFDLGKKGPTPGDQILSHDAVYTRAGKKVGTDVMTCTVVTTAPSQASCNLTFAFATGTITGQYIGSPPPRKIVAITGGTGKYLGARGQIELVESGHDNRGNTATFTLLR